MSEFIKQNIQLPSTIEDLSRFVLVGWEKLKAVRAEIAVIDSLNLVTDVRDQKFEEAQELNNALLDSEARIGQLTAQMEKHQGGDHGNQYTSGKRYTAVTFANYYLTPEEAFEKQGLGI